MYIDCIHSDYVRDTIAIDWTTHRSWRFYKLLR